jgi:hypothetical protein
MYRRRLRKQYIPSFSSENSWSGKWQPSGSSGRGQGRKAQSATREERRGTCKGSPEREGFE